MLTFFRSSQRHPTALSATLPFFIRERQKVTTKLIGSTQTSSEGAWFTNVSLLSKAIASGAADLPAQPLPPAEGVLVAEDVETKKEKEQIESESRGDHSE